MSETELSCEVVSEITAKATLDVSDQWIRTKTYTDTIHYRVEEVRVRANSRRPSELRVALIGPRILKDGRESDRVVDDGYGIRLSEVPAHVANGLRDIVTGWAAMLP